MNCRLSHRSVLLGVLVLLLAVPSLLAQPVRGENDGVGRLCAQPPVNDSAIRRFSDYKPVAPQERLLYGLKGLDGGSLEIRYRISGNVHITEVADLGRIELPQKSADSEKLAGRQTPELRGFLPTDDQQKSAEERMPGRSFEGERVLQLLSLHPDTMRKLHKLAGDGVAIDVQFLHNGRLLETLTFDQLKARTTELRLKPMLPIYAPSTTTGGGVVPPRRTLREATLEYLPNCNDCTYDHPCETECGWDPGKGGPVTCGEYGAPCGGPPTCPSTQDWGQYWTDWYYDSAGNTGYAICLQTWYNDRWHNEWVTVYRRDRIQVTRVCPNAPSCDGCYTTETVIGYQLTGVFCYYPSGFFCFNGYPPCCDSLCNPFGAYCEDGGWGSCF